MAILVVCCNCHGELTEPGGLLFSPPRDDAWTVRKDHLCARCYRAVLEFIGGEPTSESSERDRLRFLVRRIAALYEGRFTEGGHVFVDAATWNAIRDEVED